MTRPGPAPKPALMVVREGNPGKRPIREGLKLPPKCPPEPKWSEWFPVTRGATANDNKRARDDAHSAWSTVVPVLDAQGLLAAIDDTVAVDLCVCVARLRQCERQISREGVSVWGSKGIVTNPAVNAAAKYRQQLKFYVGELGLSPSSRVRLEKGDQASDPDNPFDV